MHYATIDEFVGDWGYEGGATQKMLEALNDDSLAQPVGPEDRTLARIAWHVITSIREMMERTGLELTGPGPDAPVPATAREMAEAYAGVSSSLLAQVKERWNADTLRVEDNMYGENWARGKTLAILIHHQIHHRAQMTVLMRQAGLKVPGVYGPSREEWAQYGQAAPEV